MTKSIESKILIKSKKRGRGSVFFVGDFISYGNRDAVNKALERLVEKGQMLRVARGIYCYPKMEKYMAWVWFLHRLRILPKQWQKGMAQELSQRDFMPNTS